MIRSRIAHKFSSIVLPAVLLVGCSSNESTIDSAAAQSATHGQEMTKATNQVPTATSDSLSDQLSKRAAESAAKAPEELRKSFKAAIDMVRDSGIEKTAKQVGDAAVDGELIGWDGKTFRLSSLWHEGPIVLMWYRGGWCPYCNIQLRAMQQKLEEIENAGARLVVLTPEIPEKAKETAENSGLEIVALHDRDNQLAKKIRNHVRFARAHCCHLSRQDQTAVL